MKRPTLRFVGPDGFHNYGMFLLLAGIVGLATGGGVVLFRRSYELITHWLLGGGHLVLDALAAAPAWKLLLVPTVGGLVVGTIRKMLPTSGGHHGVTNAMHATAFNDGKIPIVHTVRTFFTNIISIGTGASVGPEGPVIELGSGLGSAVGQWMKLSPERVRTLVGSGAAAGLAAAFNAPIAGAIFAVEIVLRDFAVVTFSPIIVAAVIGTALSRAFLGDAPAFQTLTYELGSPWELPLYIVLGAAAGLLGVAFTRSHHAFARLEQSRVPRPILAAAGGLVLGLAFVAGLPQLFGVGYEPTSQLLNGDLGWKLMLLLLAAKLLATNLSLGTGFTGGIFAPALLMGGALGGVFGTAVAQLPLSVGPTGAYSLVGMAALMAAVTHAPITSILILFEMTGGYEVILPLMLSCITAVAVSQALSRDSIFTLGLSRAGVDMNFGRESAILRGFYAEDLMHPDAPVLAVNCDIEEIVQRFLENLENRYYVVDDQRVLVGVIDIHDMKELVREQGLSRLVLAADIMRPVTVPVSSRLNLEETIHMFTRAEEEELPVVDDSEPARLLGAISRRDILELYNREILNREVLGIKLVHHDTDATDYVDLPDEYKVELLPVTVAMTGKNLTELDLRGRFQIHVLAIKRPSRRSSGYNELPDPRRPLSRDDRLVVVGRMEDLARCREEGV